MQVCLLVYSIKVCLAFFCCIVQIVRLLPACGLKFWVATRLSDSGELYWYLIKFGVWTSIVDVGLAKIIFLYLFWFQNIFSFDCFYRFYVFRFLLNLIMLIRFFSFLCAAIKLHYILNLDCLTLMLQK